MKIHVGAYEAKRKLPELLRGVQSGRQYAITHRGLAIADLVPAKRIGRQDVTAAIEEMKLFVAEHPLATLDEDLIKAAKRAGVKRFGGK